MSDPSRAVSADAGAGDGPDGQAGPGAARRPSLRPEGGVGLATRPRGGLTVWSAGESSSTVGLSTDDDAVPLEQMDRFFNRELSWLEFGSRLLELAADGSVPLFERVKFLGIFADGLDEFFQVRVAGLEDQIAAGLRTRSPDGMSPREQLDAITSRATELVRGQSQIYADQVAPALAVAGVVVADWHTLGTEDRAHLGEVFDRRIFPILTPLAVDHGHPFPYISDLSLNLVVRVVNPVSGERRVARVKVPPLLPRFVALPDGVRHVPVEQVIAAHLESLFPTMVISEHHAFRVTRNADLSVEEDEAEDLLAAVELELHRRRFGQAVRLEASADISSDLLDMLIAEVDVPEDNVYLFDVPIDLSGLQVLRSTDRPELGAPTRTPVTPPRLANGTDIFSEIAEGDILVHHPYESFSGSVEAFLSEAANDDDVLAIKQTLYRTGDNSPVVAALIRASQSGKQVTAVIELQARFDEHANIARARALEEAGVQVLYGLASLKTHAKISLVVRREEGGVRRYCHISTGNYNSQTAKSYEDLGLFTADPEIGADVGSLFNLLTGLGDPPIMRRLIVSPLSTRDFLTEAIGAEGRAGSLGRIVLKTNGLTDPGIIDSLYRASADGASIDLIVRGRCCLRPGVVRLSENIRVRSIVGRNLEHSRVFSFGGEGGRPRRLFIGSPDLMERNLERRVEVVVPVDDPKLAGRLADVLARSLADTANSWELGAHGGWRRASGPLGTGVLPFSVQDDLQSEALSSLRNRRDEILSVITGPQGPAEPVAPPGDGRLPSALPRQPGSVPSLAAHPEAVDGAPSRPPPDPGPTAGNGHRPLKWWQRLFRRRR
jgi:polyphosphate kinase